MTSMSITSPIVLSVRSALYWCCQVSITTYASCTVRNLCSFKHASRNLPLQLSIHAFRTGFPGWIKCSCTLRCAAYVSRMSRLSRRLALSISLPSLHALLTGEVVVLDRAGRSGQGDANGFGVVADLF